MGKQIMFIDGKSISCLALPKPVPISIVGVLVSTSQRLIGIIGVQILIKMKFLKQSFQNFFNVKGERGYWILDFLLYL